MKEVVFDEEGLKNLQQIGAELFSDENDPRSFSYVRKLKRPDINWLMIIVTLYAVTFLVALSGTVCYLSGADTKVCITVSGIMFLLSLLLLAKKGVICAVKVYQRYAPDSLRNKCRFEPSCSEYMIMAIEKYGLIKGVHKGINRLGRCNVNGGGVDFP